MRSPDEGSAVVDFVFVSVLVVALFVVVFQVGLALHTRNVLVSVAAEGARYGANADVRAAGPVIERVRDGIATAFTPDYAASASIGARTVGGVVEVTITAPFPLAFLPNGPVDVTVQGHAYEEGQ